MSYRVLDKTGVIEYLSNISVIVEYFGTQELHVDEIGDGNLNFVYKITSAKEPQKALILKQAVPYLRCVGEEFPLARERMTYEIRALQKFYSIFPTFVPKVYHENQNMSLVVIQYLGQHVIMRKGLLQGIKYKNFSDHISTYLAATLFYTSSLCLESKEKRELIDKFNSNTQLCKLTEDFVFTFAFMEHETNDNQNAKDNPDAQKLFGDMEFKSKVLGLKYTFMIHTDALIHGDLHTGSIMLNENETFVIDPEFAFVGPFGFDVGALVANLTSSYIHHRIVTKDEGFQEWLLTTIKEVLEKFCSKFLEFWKEHKNSALLLDGYIEEPWLGEYKEAFVKNILRESIGFAGCKMARRVYGVAGVEEIRGIENAALRREAERTALKIAREFVLGHENIKSVDEVLEMIKNAG